MEVHVCWGRSSAQELKRALVDSDGEEMYLANCPGVALERWGVCSEFDKAPHVPIVGTAAVSIFHLKLQVDHTFLNDITAPHAIIAPRTTSLPLHNQKGRRILRKFGLHSAVVR